MLLNTTGLVNTWNTGVAGNTVLNATAATVTFSGGSATATVPILTEAQTKWFNQFWWKDPFFNGTSGSNDWWEVTEVTTLTGFAATVTFSGGGATLTVSDNNTTLTAKSATVTFSGGSAKQSVPLVATAATIMFTGGSATQEIEFQGTAFALSKVGTFDNLGIEIGRDIVLNDTNGEGFLIVARVDVDTLFLDKIIESPPQVYKIQKYIAELTVPSVITLEFNGVDWQVIDKSPLGL